MSEALERAKKRYKQAKDAWANVYRKAKEDLEFLSDAPNSQWDQQEATNRSSVGRPVIQIDQLGQFIHQVSNDIRMNTPTIKIIPSGENDDLETAEILEGRIKAIEYKSNADAAYDMASDFAVKCSIGFIRIDHDYIGREGFNQELCIKRVIDPLCVLIDSSSIEPDGSDARYGFVFEKMSADEFKEQYPKATPLSFGEEKPTNSQEQDDVIIAEYFEIEETKIKTGLLEDGTTEEAKDGKKYKSQREVTKCRVKRYKFSQEDELEAGEFPGVYIPIIPVYGEEAWIDGKRNLYSLIRKSKGAQQMYNLWASLETELLLKQPQAPVQAPVGQMAGFEDSWKNPERAAVLYYHTKDVEGNPIPPPQRLAPPQIPTGIVNARREAIDDIKSTMGMYNASIGQRSNETSGIAIQQRKQEGDVATFHFGDNLVRSITQVGKIIVSALPEIEDTPRYVQIIGKEGESKTVGINGNVANDQERTYEFKGDYGVRVVTGPAFTTQRQEAAVMYNELVTKMPDLMPVIGDLVFKYQDTPGSQAISERMKKLVDPKFLEEDKQDPMVQQLQNQLQEITAAAQQQIQALQAELQNKQTDIEIKAVDAKLKEKELEIKQGDQLIKAKTEESKAEAERAKIALEAKKLELEEQKLLLEAQSMSMQAPTEKPTEIKLDTTGFQFSKSPEQLAAEERESLEKLAREQMELQAKSEQTAAVIGALDGITRMLGELTSTVSQPILIKRDENGNIIEAK